MNPEATKTCPYCAETIKPRAKLCPHCRQWLTLRSLHNPAVLIWPVGTVLVASLILLAVTLLSRMERVWNPRPCYTEQLGALRVLQSRMDWRQTATDQRIYLTGILTNQSAVPWREIEFECRFFDTNGVMIDVAHPHCSLTVRPWDDSAFRASVSPSRPTNAYASYTLTVNVARNATTSF
jgi:hypothetical protein